MTNQSPELFHYEDEDYMLLAFGNENIMSHDAFGVERISLSTALERGFRSTYGIKDNKLVVKSLYVDGKIAESIGGVEPLQVISYTVYKDLNIVLPYTGYVFFGNFAAYAAYWGSSHHEAIKAYELAVFDGEIFEKVDFSEKMAGKLKALSGLVRQDNDASIATEIMFQQIWHRISQFLPRHYRFIHTTAYTDFDWATNPENWVRGRRKK